MVQVEQNLSTQERAEQLTKRYQALLAKKRELEAKKVECETTLRYHKGEYEKLIEELRSDFKVSSLNEAYALRDKYEKELTETLDSLERSISSFEASLEGEQ